MPDVIGVEIVPVLALQEPVEIDDSLQEIGRFHRRP
jgi:hypothetical protein